MCEKVIPENLFVLEVANNHMGDIEHGIHVIRSFGEVFRKYPFGMEVPERGGTV